MAKSRHYYIRKTHRYLGLILGIQFLFWTVSGLYFSWTDLDEIHGDFQHKHVPRLIGDVSLTSPNKIISQIGKVDSINSLQLINILGKPHYSFSYYQGTKLSKVIADAESGLVRNPISKEEAVKIASESFNGKPVIKTVEYITSTHGHHEYRSKPLPAWAVTFDHETSTTVYVSAEIGKVESFRNSKWRLFDFLWMTHTMDYQKRDNINNWLLRAFSLFGLLTIMSGFILFWVSSKRFRRRQRSLRTVDPNIH